MVRYHSLVIDDESLPNELLPIAWTTSTDAFSFLGTHELGANHDNSADRFSSNTKKGSYRPYEEFDRLKRRKVLMGIMHSSRPHYGVQVCGMLILFIIIVPLCTILLILFDHQFHPESVATCHGRQLFENFRVITENYWRRLKPFWLAKGVSTLVY